MGPEALDQPHLQAAYREWMRQVQAANQALTVVSDDGLRWCLSGKLQWQAYRIEPYKPNQAVCFDNLGRVSLVSVDLLDAGRARELITLSSLPKEVRWLASQPKPAQTLQELLYRMCQAFPVLCEVLNETVLQ